MSFGVIVIMLVYCVLLFDLAFPNDPEQDKIADENRIRDENRVEYYESK
ncbi:hypothetical protein [Guptibacillus hwajinpoensis]